MIMRSPLRYLVYSAFWAVLCCATASFAQYPGLDDPSAAVGSAGVVGGGLVASTPLVDGGAVPMGATAQVVVRFRNDGGQAVETGAIRLYPSSNVASTVALDQCRERPLQSGAECAVALTVKGLQAGPWRVEMLMSHNGRSRLVTATLSGAVETTEGAGDKVSSDVEMIPDVLDFGSLTSSQTLVEPVVLRNITSNEIKISDVYIDSGEQAGYALKTACKALAPGQSCIATVTWSPKAKGRSSGVLVVKHSGPAGLSTVPMKGEYAPEDVVKAEVFPQAVPGRGLLVSSQEGIDFGEGIEKASTMTVSLVNVGDSALKISDILVSGSDNGVSFKEEGCQAGTVLAPVEACPLTVTWSPTRVGKLFDDIQVLHDGARGVLLLSVRGAASATVSQDQKAILLSDGGGLDDVPPISEEALADGAEAGERPKATMAQIPLAPSATTASDVVNPAGVLEGYKITSFSPTRAIINGPGGSRLVYAEEEVVMGGIPWMVLIQKNGIEFVHKAHRVLLLFDRSLSPIVRAVSSAGSKEAVVAAAESVAAPSASTPAPEAASAPATPEAEAQ